MKKLAIIAGALAVGSASFLGFVTHAQAASPCRPGAPAGETQLLYDPANPVQNELPTVYTDNLGHYVGVCGAPTPSPVFNDGYSYVQLDNVPVALAGGPILEGSTGNKATQAFIWGDSAKSLSYGPAHFYLVGQGSPASTSPHCNPSDSDFTALHANGNNVQRELPILYTDGLRHYVGICGGGGRLQVNEVGKAPAATTPSALPKVP